MPGYDNIGFEIARSCHRLKNETGQYQAMTLTTEGNNFNGDP
jgi:hypothetical protein